MERSSQVHVVVKKKSFGRGQCSGYGIISCSILAAHKNGLAVRGKSSDSFCGFGSSVDQILS